MNKTRPYDLHRMQGEGLNLAAAKRSATARLEALVHDSASPLTILAVGWLFGAIWRDCLGWSCAIFSAATLADSTEVRSCVSLETRTAAVHELAPHLLQSAWTPTITDDRAFAEAYAANLPPAIDRPALIRHFLHWTVFMRAYRTRRDAGDDRHTALKAAFAVRDAA